MRDIVDCEISRDFLKSVLESEYDDNYDIFSVNEVADVYGHGTHVAGIIAAEGNNAVGVCGVIWNAKLASLRVANHEGRAEIAKVILALDYAIDEEIHIVNISMATETDNHSLEMKVFEYCNEGGLLICAAGNAPVGEQGTSNDVVPHYPSNYEHPNIIAVGAINSTNTPCNFSHYGSTSVDIFAPGFRILSCYPDGRCNGNCGQNLETGEICYTPDNTSGYSGGYHFMNGTSMAAPFVTGVAALIKAKYPTLSATQIKNRIMQGARQVNALDGLCVSGGKLDAYRALHGHSCSSYTQYNSSTHSGVCSCGVTIQQTHSCTYTQISNTTHRASCACGYSLTESHNFMPSGSGYLCFDCSYYTPFIQGFSLIVDPETE